MSGKPSVPLLLPPLSREALSQIHEIEDEVREALEDCTDPILGFTNPEKTRQIVRTYLVAAIDVKMGYYSSLPIYQVGWIPEIIISTVNFFLGMLHPFATNARLRNDLLRTAAEHLAQKTKAGERAKKSERSDRQKLKDEYLSSLSGEVKILDICWAAEVFLGDGPRRCFVSVDRQGARCALEHSAFCGAIPVRRYQSFGGPATSTRQEG